MASAAAAADPAPPPYPDSLALSLLAFHRTIGPIRKQSEAKYGKFADLNTVLEAVTPALLEQGLVLTQVLEDTTDHCQRLTTRLEHAPTGAALTSTCLLPTLQQLLERVHELRQAALGTYPLDLQLAAIGALPPVLPPRNVAPQGAPPSGATPNAELPPPPQREPGLRIEDQLKGLYTLLGQLGTTTNPLHSLGGTITYLRRYQILAILSLAPTDDDGQVYGAELQQLPAATGNGTDNGQHAAAPSQPAPRSRSRSTRTATPRPQPPPPPPTGHADQTPQAPQGEGRPPQAQPQPAPPAAPLVAHADQQQATAQAAAHIAPAPAPAVDAGQVNQTPQPAVATDSPLLPVEVQQLIALIRTLPSERVAQLVQGFRLQFGLQPTVLVSDYIKTHEHAQFIRQQVAALAPEPAAAAA